MTEENTTAAAAEAQAETQGNTEVQKPESQEQTAEGTTTEANDQSAENAAENTEAGSGDDAGGDQSKAKPNRVSAKDRISQLTAARREAERVANEAKGRAERAEARLATLETPKPRRDDFDDADDYQAALSAHESAKIIKKDREGDVADAKHEADAASKQASEAAQYAYQERVADFSERTPDYAQVVNDRTLPISDAMGRQILESDEGPAIAYWLGTNRAEAARISRIGSEIEVAREFGRIEARLNSKPPQKVTEAPKPISAIATGAGSASKSDPSKMSMPEYRKWREAKKA